MSQSQEVPNSRITENQPRPLQWSEVEKNFEKLQPVEGGYSNARRGIITLNDEQKIFVKIGVNEHTKRWASKEIKVYDFLTEHSYSYIPNLLSVNEDNTGFALEALLPEDGWDWSETWTRKRLDATFAALDTLAEIKPDHKYNELLKPVITEDDMGWVKLIASQEQQEFLKEKLSGTSDREILNNLSAHVTREAKYKVRHDTLVHDDVRADNCPWNESTGQVKLVDWNWLEMGDRGIDLSAMLVHIHNSGFDVLPDFKDRLNTESLHFMAGFWFEAASKPIWPGGPEKLRKMQLQSAITALHLANQIRWRI